MRAAARRGDFGMVRKSVPMVCGTVPFVIGGVSLLAEAGGGLYWILAGIVCALVGGVLNAWVFLVEIRR
jgi:hypothetical protein